MFLSVFEWPLKTGFTVYVIKFQQVLQRAQKEMMSYEDTGVSVMGELSHYYQTKLIEPVHEISKNVAF